MFPLARTAIGVLRCGWDRLTQEWGAFVGVAIAAFVGDQSLDVVSGSLASSQLWPSGLLMGSLVVFLLAAGVFLCRFTPNPHSDRAIVLSVVAGLYMLAAFRYGLFLQEAVNSAGALFWSLSYGPRGIVHGGPWLQALPMFMRIEFGIQTLGRIVFAGAMLTGKIVDEPPNPSAE